MRVVIITIITVLLTTAAVSAVGRFYFNSLSTQPQPRGFYTSATTFDIGENTFIFKATNVVPLNDTTFTVNSQKGIRLHVDNPNADNSGSPKSEDAVLRVTSSTLPDTDALVVLPNGRIAVNSNRPQSNCESSGSPCGIDITGSFRQGSDTEFLEFENSSTAAFINLISPSEKSFVLSFHDGSTDRSVFTVTKEGDLVLRGKFNVNGDQLYTLDDLAAEKFTLLSDKPVIDWDDIKSQDKGEFADGDDSKDTRSAPVRIMYLVTDNEGTFNNLTIEPKITDDGNGVTRGETDTASLPKAGDKNYSCFLTRVHINGNNGSNQTDGCRINQDTSTVTLEALNIGNADYAGCEAICLVSCKQVDSSNNRLDREDTNCWGESNL